jgi:hypothetical protein
MRLHLFFTVTCPAEGAVGNDVLVRSGDMVIQVPPE